MMHLNKEGLLPAPLSTVADSPVLSTLIAAVLCVVSYTNSLHGDLVHDDVFVVQDNMDIRPSAPLSNLLVNDFWGKPMADPTSHKSYRPLTVLTFRMNYLVSQLEPWGYHVVNICLHVLVTGLLGYLCRRLLSRRRTGDLAFMSMCLFASHPVHTEAVTGIVGRADVLACVFFLLSLLLYMSCVAAINNSLVLRTVQLVVSLLCAGSAMLSKEHGATVLGVCMAYDVIVVNRHKLLRVLNDRKVTSDLYPLILRSTVLLSTAATLLLFRLWLLHGHLPHFGAQDNPASFSDSFLTRGLTYSYLFYYNARLLLYPAVLCYDYQMGSIPVIDTIADLRNLATVLFYFVIFCLTWRSFHGNDFSRVSLIGLLLIVVPFLPASNLLIRVGFVVAERILYISSMGYCILVAHGAISIGRRFKSSRPIISFILLALVGMFCLRTIRQNPVWRTRESLFRSGLEILPHNAKMHFNYANLLKDTNRINESIDHYQTAISLWPEHSVSHNNLGTLLSSVEDAEFHFRRAIQYNSQHFKAFFNLGNNLQRQGRMEEAEEMLRRSLSINAHYADALMALATLLADNGRTEEGWPYMEQAVSVAPGNADILNNLGAYLLRLRRVDDALKAYHQALTINPKHSVVMSSIARVHRSRGETTRAEEWFKRSLSAKQDPVTYHHLGALYHNNGDLQSASRMFAEALRTKPEKLDTICSYGQTLLQLSRHVDVIAMGYKALQVHPSAPCLHTMIASAYMQSGGLDKALEHSTLALKSDSGTSPEALHVHGAILKNLGRLHEAEQAYQQAVNLNPANPTPRVNLGALLHLRKAFKEARVQYEAALTLDPDNQLVRENLMKLSRLENASH